MNESEFCLAACQHCGQRIEFPREGLGIAVSCPQCNQETLLQEVSAAPVAASEPEEITAAELKEVLAGVLPKRKVSVLYQIGLLAVAVFMVLLPVVYLLFVAALGYATYWYGVHAKWILSGFIGGVHLYILKLIAYVGPLIGGSLAVFFMFKPILARPARRAEPMELNPAQHPRLYQFIAHLSDLLQVPVPQRIYLSGELNASAGFRRGFLSFLGHDLVLTLGLPLVGGLDTRQLAAVVCHELGHCTQGFAMRLQYVIFKVERWFARVVYERDSWDQAVQEWADDTHDWRMSIVVACVGLAIWISRTILACLLHIGHASSCFLSRQMEYHADSCALSVAGSVGLESLLLRLREQTALNSMAFGSLQQIWKKQHKLPDNLPGYLAELEARLPSSFHDEARLTLLNEKVGRFATHPTPVQRIQKARQQAVEDVFSLAKPARLLFRDFARTAREVTCQYYRQDLQLAVTDPMLKPVDSFFPASENITRGH
jgi:Zn-dependent protease with chaperone function